ncbi:error-prone DNA polymerase [Parapedomonas caeni]
MSAPAYAELQVTSHFTFLEGASSPDELMTTAVRQGLAALAITDRNSLAGVVRAHVAARKHGLPLVIGCRLDLEDAPSLLAYPTDRAAYGRLSQLLSRGKRRAAKGACHLRLADVTEAAPGQIFVLLPPVRHDRASRQAFRDSIAGVRAALGGQPLYLALHRLFRGDDLAWLGWLADCAARHGLPLVATNDVLYHLPERRPLADVMTCIRDRTTIHDAGLALGLNAERHLKTPAEMARLFADYPHALAATLDIVAACRFDLAQLAYEYPDEPVPPGKTAQQHLEELAWAGAAVKFPAGVPESVRQTIDKELRLIAARDYAPFFLTVHDIVAFARSRDILCQGRGSSANSVVCFCLGITAVNPTEVALLFERFVNEERREPPDIDVDFEHERREEVIQYIYERYGRARAGLAATVIHYRPRSAIRDVGKAMGLSEDVVTALAGTIWGSWAGDGIADQRIRALGLDPREPLLARTVALANELLGCPRHLSQHVGGFVLTRGPLEATVPIGNAAMAGRTFIEWDKDDIEALGILKVDVLALGMLTCLRKGLQLLAQHHGRDVRLATIPREDPATYDMLCRGDSIGVFQVESRAQMNMLPRLKPRCYYDLVIQVAIVRPGPIQGDMVHPYLRRRDGLEEIDLPGPAPAHGPASELRDVLGRTLGVPLFQEQAMKVAMVAAEFSAAEANGLRYAMATFRHKGTIGDFERRFIDRMIARGYAPDFARRCFDQIKGFGDYGFPESHAASFAILVYASAWLKCHYPDVFCAALLNAQPMGFYAPAQIVRDARDHGVPVLPPDINHADWDCTLVARPGHRHHAVRLGLRLITGLGREAAERLMAARASRPFASLDDLQRRARLPVGLVETLATADACGSLGLDRRQALWAARALARARPLPLFEQAGEAIAEPSVVLPALSAGEQVVEDYRSLRLSLKGHPLAFLREAYRHDGVSSCARAQQARDGSRLNVAGLVLVRQRPGTASGVVFMTIEDETGICNVVVWPKVMEKYRAIVMGSRLVRVRGRIQRLDATPGGAQPAVPVVHLVAASLTAHDVDLLRLGESPLAASPTQTAPLNRSHPRDVRIIPRSRDFH